MAALGNKRYSLFTVVLIQSRVTLSQRYIADNSYTASWIGSFWLSAHDIATESRPISDMKVFLDVSVWTRARIFQRALVSFIASPIL
jgi:hypothetical protein